MKILLGLATLIFAFLASAETNEVTKNKALLATFQAQYLPTGSWEGRVGASYTCTVDAQWSPVDAQGNTTLTVDITSTFLSETGEANSNTTKGTYTYSVFDDLYFEEYEYDKNAVEYTLYKSSSLNNVFSQVENLSVVRNPETNELVDVSVSDLVYDGESDPSDNSISCWDLKPKQ